MMLKIKSTPSFNQISLLHTGVFQAGGSNVPEFEEKKMKISKIFCKLTINELSPRTYCIGQV